MFVIHNNNNDDVSFRGNNDDNDRGIHANTLPEMIETGVIEAPEVGAEEIVTSYCLGKNDNNKHNSSKRVTNNTDMTYPYIRDKNVVRDDNNKSKEDELTNKDNTVNTIVQEEEVILVDKPVFVPCNKNNTNRTSERNSDNNDSNKKKEETEYRQKQGISCPICYEEFYDESENDTDAITNKTSAGDYSIGYVMNANEKIGICNSSDNENKKGDNENKKVKVLTISGCGHQFCRECLFYHCRFALGQKQVPIPCPQQQGIKEEMEGIGISNNQQLQQSSSDIHPDKTNTDSNIIINHSTRVSNTHYLSAEFVRSLLTNQVASAILRGENETTEEDHVERGDIEKGVKYCQSDSLLQTFDRLQNLVENPTLIECPRCNNLQKPLLREKAVSFLSSSTTTTKTSLLKKKNSSSIFNPTENNQNHDIGHDDPASTCCSSCNHIFCSIHGDIHRGISCKQFSSSKKAKRLEKVERMIRKLAKPCSHCGAYIMKQDGCDHIICTNCYNDMCFKCGTHTSLSGTMFRTCLDCKQSYVDHRYYWQYKCLIFSCIPVLLIFTVLYIVAVVAVSILSCGFGCCLGCGSTNYFLPPYHPVKGLRAVMSFIGFPFLVIGADLGLCESPLKDSCNDNNNLRHAGENYNFNHGIDDDDNANGSNKFEDVETPFSSSISLSSSATPVAGVSTSVGMSNTINFAKYKLPTADSYKTFDEVCVNDSDDINSIDRDDIDCNDGTANGPFSIDKHKKVAQLNGSNHSL